MLTADAQALAGDMTADNISSITAYTQEWLVAQRGHQHGEDGEVRQPDARRVKLVDRHRGLVPDKPGTDSAIKGTTISNIVGNGHTVTYVSSANPGLGGKTYTLSGGGTLKPRQLELQHFLVSLPPGPSRATTGQGGAHFCAACTIITSTRLSRLAGKSTM